MLGARKPKRPLPRRRPAARPQQPALDLVARLLYRDALLLVIDKPAGLPVHAGPKGGATLEDDLGQLRFGLPNDPQLAHRLDRDTSGCLALGRHRKALQRLGALFAAGKVEKTYWAVVIGGPTGDSGRIDQPLAKLNAVRGWKMIASPDGRPAATEWEVLGRGPGLAWLACRPLTGRTHQIRVHLAGLGCPILGDPLYGPKSQESRGRPLHLHARRLSIPLYPNKPAVAAEAPLPPALHAAFAACGWRESRPAV
jgi:RluA family pseudouridine synthase